MFMRSKSSCLLALQGNQRGSEEGVLSVHLFALPVCDRDVISLNTEHHTLRHLEAADWGFCRIASKGLWSFAMFVC